MPKVNAPLYSLNGGEVGKEALARLDLDRMQFAGSEYSNVLPRVIGSMTIRPGLEYIAAATYGDSAMLEFSKRSDVDIVPILNSGGLRILRGGSYVARAAVGATVTNGDFSAFAGWTDDSTGGATASVSGGQLNLSGAAFSRSTATTAISISDQGVEHGLRVVVARGPVHISLGTAAGLDDLIANSAIDDGDHSLAFTPQQATVYLSIWTSENRLTLVDSCQIDVAGDLVLSVPFTDVSNVRFRQSIDKIYLAVPGYQQREIHHRGPTSWNVQRYKPTDGPFELYGGEISMEPSVFVGNGTLTASQVYFSTQMIGSLFRLTQGGQTVEAEFNAGDQQGQTIRISGVGSARRVDYSVANTGFVATWSLQVALDDGSGTPVGWITVTSGSGQISSSYTDPNDNVIKFIRFSVNAGNFTSGAVRTTLNYNGGSQDGIFVGPLAMFRQLLWTLRFWINSIA